MSSSLDAYLAWGVSLSSPEDDDPFEVPRTEYIHRHQQDWDEVTHRFTGPFTDETRVLGGNEDEDDELETWIALQLDPGQRGMGAEESTYAWVTRTLKEADLTTRYAGNLQFGDVGDLDRLLVVESSLQNAYFYSIALENRATPTWRDPRHPLVTVLERAGLERTPGWRMWPSYG